MWMATWIQWSKWSVPPHGHTVPHAHHACLEGPALHIPGNQINEIQCDIQCTCTCYAVHDMCMLCYAVTLVRTVQLMWTGVTGLHTHTGGCFCSIYCSVQMCLCTFWNRPFRYVCTLSVVLLVYSIDCTSVWHITSPTACTCVCGLPSRNACNVSYPSHSLYWHQWSWSRDAQMEVFAASARTLNLNAHGEVQ